jgi:hypothetical protein
MWGAKVNSLQRTLEFLAELNNRGVYYRLNHVRDSLMVEVAVPGERWEVEFFADGAVEVEVFRSNGHLSSGEEAATALERLLRLTDERGTA